MKIFTALAACALLAGCVHGPSPYHAAAPRDPSQWRVVSVTPVPAGTAARVAAKSPDGNAVEYSSQPAPFYPTAPVYTPAPAYGSYPVYGSYPAYGAYPVYGEPSVYWPPVTVSLGFVFGKQWGRGHFRHRHRR